MPRPTIPPSALRFGVGTICIVLLFAAYLASAPPVVRSWVAGAARPSVDGGWYEWPQWSSALMVSMASGLIFAAATRLGASTGWAASASLAHGFGWAPWMLALAPSAKSVALLLVACGVAAIARWSTAPANATSYPLLLTRWLSLHGWLLVAALSLLTGAWLDLRPGAGVAMPVSVSGVVRLLVGELRLLAAVLAAVGFVQMWSRARPAALALGAMLAVYLILPLLDVVSPDAAMVSASVFLWVAVAFGLQWVAQRSPERTMVMFAVILAMLVPGERVLINHTSVAPTALPFLPGSLALGLAAVSPGGTLLSDGPGTDRQIARTAALRPVGPFQVVRTAAWDRNPADVFAFAAARRALEAAGFAFRTVPRRAPLSAFLRMMPTDAIVAVALTPVAADALRREPADYFSGVGAGAPNREAPAQAFALVGRAGAASGALVQQNREAAQVTVTRGMPWSEPARPSPIEIDVSADRNSAAIAVEGRELVRVPHGGAVVVTSLEGFLHVLHVITPEQKLLLPVPPDAWSLAQLVSARLDGSGPVPPDPLFVDPMDASALVRFDGRDAAYFMNGWHAPERDGAIDFIWTSEAQSRLLIPLPHALELRVLVELRPGAIVAEDPPLVGLNINGVKLDRQPVSPMRRTYEWRVPETVWRVGANVVAIELTKLTQPVSSHDRRRLGVAVSLFRLERVRR